MQLIGRQFDGFQILRELAKGALSRVFLASDGKVIKAVKVFPNKYRKNAEREYAYGKALHHPHLNTVEDTVEIAGYPGVLMPFVAGERLDVWFGNVPRTAFLKTFSGVLSALGYLHSQSIIHRDIKPENVIVASDGNAKVLDFDLAVHAGELKRLQTVVGSVAYLSPEQARGEPASKASDIYAAGIILYQGLTGEVPFSGSIEEVMAAHRDLEPKKPSSFNEDLSPFDEVLIKLLAKDQQDRFGSSEEVLAALKAVLVQLEA